MFFRRYPYLLLNFRLLYGAISRRSPILWNNFMKGENIRRLKIQKEKEFATGKLKTIPIKGAWRDDSEIRKPHSSTGKWMSDN